MRKLRKIKIVISNYLNICTPWLCSNIIAGAQKSRVVSEARRLGIPYSSTWDHTCTTLIMTAISTTVKVGVVSGRVIVVVMVILTYMGERVVVWYLQWTLWKTVHTT